MRSPYMWFVQKVALVINGAYPEHYDSTLQKRVRRTLLLSVISMGIIEIATDSSIMQVPMFASSTTVLEQVSLLFIFLLIFPVVYLSAMRLTSIEENILETSLDEVRYQSSNNDTVVDTNLLYDYLKVFATLMIIFSIPDLVYLFVETKVIQVVSTSVLMLQVYYFLIIVEYGASVGGRWSRKYISNDRSQKTDMESETS